jgi:hypothetical protein
VTLNITTMPWPPRPQSFCRTLSTLSGSEEILLI